MVHIYTHIDITIGTYIYSIMKKLLLIQADRFIEPLHALKLITPPKTGWIRYIRKTLGMTALQLAKRLNVTRRRITKIEEDEMQEALTIKTLKNIANAMECQLVYAIVPKTTIMQTIENQVKKIVTEQLTEISHHMNLENQGITDQKILNLQIEELIHQYFNKSFKHLWDK